jgi:hypothetical protein
VIPDGPKPRELIGKKYKAQQIREYTAKDIQKAAKGQQKRHSPWLSWFRMELAGLRRK